MHPVRSSERWPRMLSLLALTIVFVTFAPTARAADYAVNVTRLQSNLYVDRSARLVIETRSCFEFAFFASATFRLIDGTTAGELRFSNGAVCQVTNYFEGQDLAAGSYPTVLTGSDYAYQTIDGGWLVETLFFCSAIATGNSATLTLTRYAVSGNAFGSVTGWPFSSCSLNWIYRSPKAIGLLPSSVRPLPDLVVSGLTVPASAVAGQPMQVALTVSNQGTAASGAIKARVYFSLDRIKSESDIEFAVCNFSAVAAGSSSSCSGPITLPIGMSAGSYYVIALVDADNDVIELNEANNAWATLGTVAVQPSNLHTLVVQRTGAGGGEVRSADGVLNCPGACSQTAVRGSQVTLTATPTFGSVFKGWSGACTGTAGCVVTMDTAKSVTASFAVAGVTLQVPWITQATGYLSRFAIVNTSAKAVNYSLTLIPEAGGVVRLRPEFANGVLPPRTQTMIGVEQLVESFSGSTRAAVVLSADASGTEISGMYNLVQPSSGSISNLPFVDSSDRTSPSATLTLPWLTGETAYSTDLVLSNLSDRPITATLSLLAKPGSGATLLLPRIDVPAKSQVLLPAAQVVNQGPLETSGLSLTVNGPPGLVKATYVMFHRSTGAANATELPVASSVTAPVTTLVVPWFSVVGGYDSRFVLTNRGGVPAPYTIELLGEAGNQLGLGVLTGTVPARGQIEIPAPSVLTSTSAGTRAGAVFTVQGSPTVIDGSYQIRSLGTGALSQTVMAKPSSRVTTASTLVLPWFSRVSGYLSRFVLVNRGATPAPFTIEILPEAGNSMTELKLAGGVVPARGQLVLGAETIVTGFNVLPRAAAVLRVAAPDADVEALYNIVNPETGSISNTLLTHAQETVLTAATVPVTPQTVGVTDLINNHAVGFIAATDPLGRPLTYTLVTPPTSGSVTVDAITGQFRYVPNGGTVTNDSFRVAVFNGVSTKSTTVALRPDNDPLFRYQWSLRNTGQDALAGVRPVAGNDINVLGAWALGYSGQGVKIGIIDSGLEVAHADLVGNVDLGNSKNFVNGSNNPTPISLASDHGTMVAGIAAAGGFNNIGGRGVAFNSRLRGYNYLANQSLANLTDSMGGASFSQDNDIFNLSIGSSSRSLPSFTGDFQTATAIAGDLRGGKGAPLIGAAGNDFRQLGDNGAACASAISLGVSCSTPATWERNGGYYPIIVGALRADGRKSSYSNAGSALWISAPGGEYGGDPAYSFSNQSFFYDPAIVTTDRTGCNKVSTPLNALDTVWGNPLAPSCVYTAKMNGTSAAAPNLSGVVALMLQANPRLTVRDVKHILARTARQTDPGQPAVRIDLFDGRLALEQGWVTNVAGYAHSNWYGFGAVDAHRAVSLARATTQLLPGEAPTRSYSFQAPAGAVVPKNRLAGYEISFDVNEPATTVESVVLFFSLSATPSMGCNQVEVYSPSGTRSILLNAGNGLQNLSVDNSRLASHAFYGERLNGTWRVRFLDVCGGANTVLSSTQAQSLSFLAR